MRIELTRDSDGKKLFALQFTNRPGSWRRPGEWCFGRQACDGSGCIVYDIGWFWVEWLRGEHLQEKWPER